MSKKKIGFVTCKNLSRYKVSNANPLFTMDDQVAADYLQGNGFVVEPVVWGERVEDVKARHFERLVIRSPWDYSDNAANRRNFQSWLESLSAEVPLSNPLPVVLWNLDKHYLQNFAALDVPVVETIFVKRVASTDLYKALNKWSSLVIKPCVSAGARDTFLLSSSQDVERIVDVCSTPQREFMLQPYIQEIEQQGEWSLIFINGQYCHAVHKLPAAGNWLVQNEHGGSTVSAPPPPEILSAAERVYAQIEPAFGKPLPEKILYARVDLIPTAEKGVLLGELELGEPELFFLSRDCRTGLASQYPQAFALSKFLEGIRGLTT